MLDTEEWDLGDPQGAMKALDQPCNTGTPFSGTCNDWQPMKGSTLRSRRPGSAPRRPSRAPRPPPSATSARPAIASPATDGRLARW